MDKPFYFAEEFVRKGIGAVSLTWLSDVTEMTFIQHIVVF